MLAEWLLFEGTSNSFITGQAFLPRILVVPCQSAWVCSHRELENFVVSLPVTDLFPHRRVLWGTDTLLFWQSVTMCQPWTFDNQWARNNITLITPYFSHLLFYQSKCFNVQGTMYQLCQWNVREIIPIHLWHMIQHTLFLRNNLSLFVRKLDRWRQVITVAFVWSLHWRDDSIWKPFISSFHCSTVIL